jgi:organic hydroperoxide reductase OsmC/OhrA
MMGSFAAVLAKSRIKTSEDLYRAEVTGDIEEANGIVKITRINVEYFLKAPPEKHGEAKKAFNAYLPLCPAAQSVIGCIDIQHVLNLSNG